VYPRSVDVIDRLIMLDYFRKEDTLDALEESVFTRVVQDAVDKNIIRDFGVSAEDLIRFINMALIMEVRYLHHRKEDDKTQMEFFNNLFTLFFHGLNGLRRKK
jgi:hypothetical protein